MHPITKLTIALAIIFVWAIVLAAFSTPPIPYDCVVGCDPAPLLRGDAL